MGIQSSLNSLLSQAQMLATFYKGFDKAEDILGKQKEAANEAKIQTEIAAGNAPMKDGKVDPEWLQQRRKVPIENNRRAAFYEKLFNPDGKLLDVGEERARVLEKRVNKGFELYGEDKKFYNNPTVQNYLKSFASNSKLKNEVAENLARASVEARTASINKTKSNFDEHVASLIKYYGKGSGNP